MTAAAPKIVAATTKRKGASQDEEDLLSSAVMVEMHQLIKQSTLYTSENQAQREQLAAAQQAIYNYGRRTGQNPKLYFADKSAFVGKRLLRANRQIYEQAIELGQLLGRFGVDELAIGYDVQVDELRQLQVTFGNALRGTGPAPQTVRFPRVRLRKGRPRHKRRKDDEMSPQEVLIKSYCLAVIAVRRFLAGVQQGKIESPAQLQRVAEQLVDITQEMAQKQSPAFLAGVVLYNVRHESAGRAVNAAMLALAMGRQLTDQLGTLSRMAMAELLYDVGLPRVAGTGPTGESLAGAVLPRIGVEQEHELPAATALVMTAMAGCGEAAMMHTALVYEALCLNLRENCDSPYGGQHAPSLEARIIATARRFVELLADPSEERTAEQAMMEVLAFARDEADKTVCRLLMAALGMFPTGTMVELSNGQLAQVLQTPNDPRRFGFPVVQPMVDAHGGRVQSDPVDMAAAALQGLAIVRVAALGTGSAKEQRSAPPWASIAPPARAPAPPVVVAAPPPAPPPPPPPALPPAMEAAPTVVAPRRPEVTSQPRTGQFLDATAMYAEPMGGMTEHAAPAAQEWAQRPGQLAEGYGAPGEAYPASNEAYAPNEAYPASNEAYGPSGEAYGPSGEAYGPSGEAYGPSGEAYGPSGEAYEAHDQQGVEARESFDGPPVPDLDDEPEDGATAIYTGGSQGLADLLARAAAASGSAEPVASAPVVTAPERHITPVAPPTALSERGAATIARRQQATGDWVRNRIAGVRPTAQGVLQKTPLVHLLVFALDKKLTGTMVLTAADGVGANLIYFEAGIVAKVRASGRACPLGELLVEMGALDPALLPGALAAIEQTGELLGEHLVQQGLCALEAVGEALAQQAVRKIERMLQLPGDTSYAFYAQQRLLDDYGGPELILTDSLALILSGARMRAGDPLIDDTLARFGELPLGLHPAADIGRLGLWPDEQQLVALMKQQPLSLSQLLSAGVAAPQTVKHLVYALAITRFLNLGGQSRDPVGCDVDPRAVAQSALRQSQRGVEPSPRSDPRSAQEWSPPSANTPSPPSSGGRVQAASRPPDDDESPSRRFRPAPTVTRKVPTRAAGAAPAGTRSAAPGPPAPTSPRATPQPGAAAKRMLTREEVEQRFAAMDAQNFFQVLGINEQTPPDAMQSVYFALAKVWHPDRAPAELADLKPKIARIFARINDAFQTLSDPTRRQVYAESLTAGAKDDEEILKRAVDSAMLFQKAEVLFKKGQLAQAEGMVQQCADADPQPEYIALLAWIQAQRLGEPATLAPGQKIDIYLPQIKLLDRSLAAAPDYERGLFYRAELYKRSGMTDQAIRDYKRVVALNPRNIDAAREVRLYAMKNADKQGLLGKFFKKE